MAASDHNFRYLVKPGTDFAFVSKFRLWIAMSGLLITISIASLFVNKAVRGSYLNWTIDFKGGTEIIYKFKDRAKPDSYVYADAGKVRGALGEAGAEGFDVSEMTWTEEVGDKEVTVRGAMVRTPRFGAMTPAQQKAAGDAFAAKFADRGIDSMQWSGDRLFVRSKAHITDAEAGEVFKASGLEIKPWGASAALYSVPDEGTGEYKQTFAMFGLDRQYELVLEKALPEVDVVTEATSQVSAKAGAELRNEGIKALFYAMLLITLYLAVRFDVRYAPGAILATMHDAIMVIGVFSVTWTDVSLTSVAALLTVIGFSVNDTVVIFDRIRENQVKLKDKRLERIVDISLNEVVVRSILTSATVFAVTLIMNVFGTGLVRNFAFAMNAGIITGAYSSIFLAPPVFLWVSKRFYSGPAPKRAGAKAAAAEA
ncbi:MAG: protein translocase subunit SecF [Myxococcales bacterium]|nr:protein translocase subunit SecF [Myxococcales bacterium]MBK7196798.1 protein translocase subunit SecF [Myxococcales bacterium]MBP6844092.1 protein translocase subunit SecF [Kofleriaceae bacterium]